MSYLNTSLREVLSVLRGAYPNAKAGRLSAKGLRLEKAGRYEEAFAMTGRALACLPTSTNQISDPTMGLIFVITVLHADLAL
jgi:hypothetical protein